jgi:hypothetical protein
MSIWDVNVQKYTSRFFMFCDIISYMKHRCPESDSKILGDFSFLTIVHTEETEHREIISLYNCFTYAHACMVWHI